MARIVQIVKRCLQRVSTSVVLCVLFTVMMATGHFFSWTSIWPVGALAGQDPHAMVTVLLELEQPSVAEVYAQITSASEETAGVSPQVTAAGVAATTAAHLALVEHEQQRVLDALADMDIAVVYRVQRVYNGIAVRIARDKEGMLATLPGVKALHNVVPKRPLNDRSVPHIGAPFLWHRDGGEDLTGAGVSIAIVDTGIDYLHSDFGGPATGYSENDPAKIGDIAGFPGVKVMGGYDFAGDSYNSDPEADEFDPTPDPDPDPMDCYGSGHGTHVAGTAAGFGVTGDRQTYHGPYSSELDFSSFAIGPGVAPHATLYALKVFGCSGTSEIVDLGIEWAVDPNGDGDFSDHVDVINLSLGSVYGATYHSTSVAAERATQVGVIVVASAGNERDTYYAVGSPSVADSVISVAAVAADYGSRTLAAPAHDQVTGFSSRGPRRSDSMLKPDLSAPGQSIRSAQAGGSGAGSYVASGTSMAAPHVSGSLALLRQLYPDYGIQATHTISNWSVSDLKALVMNTAHPDIRASSAPTAPLLSPVRVGGGGIDLLGARETGVIVYNGDDPGLISVSFGAPPVLDQLHLVKNIYMENKEGRTLTYTVGYSSVVDMPGVTFELPSMFTMTIPAGARVSFPLGMHAVANDMAHTRDASVAPTQGFSPQGLPRHWLSEEAGYLVVRPVEQGRVLRLPIYAAPRRASQMLAEPHQFDFGTNDQASAALTLIGQPIVSNGILTPQLTNEQTHVSAFLLQYVSINDEPAHIDPGLLADSTDLADLKYVGVSGRRVVEDGRLGSESTVYFAVATHAPWSTPNVPEFDILIDANRDGQDDYRVYNSDFISYLFDNQVSNASDAFITVVEDLAANVQTLEGFVNVLPASKADTTLYNANVMIIPAPAAAIGLHEGNTGFTYYVRSYSVDIAYGVEFGRHVEVTPKLYFDLARPGLDTTNSGLREPLYPVVSGSTIPIHYMASDYARAAGKGLLLFFHQNLPGEHVQVVPVQTRWSPTIYLPVIGASGLVE